MFLWILFGGTVAYLLYRREQAQAILDRGGVAPIPNVITSDGTPTKTAVREGFAPEDWQSVPQLATWMTPAGLPTVVDWSTVTGALGSLGGLGLGGLDMGGLGGFNPTLDRSAGLNTYQRIPSGAVIEKLGASGAVAPLKLGERMMFNVKRTDGDQFLGTLEGRWEGPTDADEEGGVIVVDRIADRGSQEGVQKQLAFGRYAIPAATNAGYHPFIERPEWYAVDPSKVGLVAFSAAPNVPAGTLMTAVLSDNNFTRVAAVVEVVSGSGDGYVVKPVRVYRILTDEGLGPIAWSVGTRINMTSAQIVDPASLKAGGGSAKGLRVERSIRMAR